MGSDLREWALNWLKGPIVIYIYMKDWINSIMLFGRVRRYVEPYGVVLSDVRALVNVIVPDSILNLGFSKRDVGNSSSTKD